MITISIDTMNSNDRLVLAAIIEFNELGKETTRAAIADQLGITERTVTRCVRRLEHAQKVKTRNLGPKGNVYKVLDDPR